LELGLFEESAEKFSLAVEKSKMTSTNISAVAAYGHGQALLAMAQQDLHDGKAGAALAHVLLAIEGCERSESTSCCMSKLRGDLHSFSASLPTRLFGERDEESVLKCHIDVVAHGEAAYLQAKEAVVAPNEEEKSLLCGSLLCDLACNTLLQAQLLAQWHCTGTDSAMKSLPSAVADAFNRAADKFRQAIQLSPLYAPAWCGLGCSLSASKDNSDTMMLAQHAFCRALQLDPLFPDAYANLAFLYTSKDAFTVSERVTDALTQVADSPMMWINRALILERRAAANQPNNSSIVKDQAQEFTQQASDAYRAAAQVVKPPSVVLGLAATGRIAPEVPDWDYKSYCTEYKAMSTGSILDKELIKIFRSPGAGEERSSIPPNADDAGPISTAALVVREPNRGELWLKLARELVVSRDNDKSEKHSADDALSAETAARRAASIFMLQLTDLTSSSSLGNAHRTAAPGVDAKELSEALTLVQWLDSSLPKQDVMVDDSDSAQQAFPRPSVDLQRALLMNPQNRLTREAIRQSQ
jgi:tetratricopeptide (TPR) repeat protein